MKRKYLKLEYSITLFVLLGVLLLIMPFSFNRNRQANFISKWNENLDKIQYMLSVINVHAEDGMLKKLNEAKSTEEKEELMLTLIKPYLRVDLSSTPLKGYKPKYMNGLKVFKGQKYYFEDFYFGENNSIVGIKDIKTNKKTDPLFLMMFDMNGVLPPNKWGYDIFGVNVFDGGEVKAFGYDMDLAEMRKDCSKIGTGISCSYYYKIGGSFEDD